MTQTVRIHKTGGAEVLEWEDAQLGAPGAGEVRIRHSAIGVNYIDIYHRTGAYPLPLPSGLGVEGAGVVVAVGEGVNGFQPGDRVAYAGGPPNAYSEERMVPAARVLKLPDNVPFEVAASLTFKGLTVEYLIRRCYAVKPGDTVLLHAAAGGIGSIACQWLKDIGATVIGTVIGADKAAYARENGCTHTIEVGSGDLVEQVKALTNGEGVHVVYDSIGKDTGVALASNRFYQEAKIPVFNSVATGTAISQQFAGQPENYVFRTTARDAIQAPKIVEEAVDRQGFKKVAILSDSTNYGQLGREDLEKALAAKGMKPVAVEKFNLKDVDMTAQLLKAKGAGAEVILTYAIGPELAQIANGMTKIGWKVPMVGSWTLAMASFIENAGQGAEGARMPMTFIQEPTNPKRATFISNYLKAFNPKGGLIEAPACAAQGYDAMLLLAAAIKQANSTDGTKIREALENLQKPVEGVVATYDRPYSKDNHEAITPDMLSIGEIKGGRIVYAYPNNQKAAIK